MPFARLITTGFHFQSVSSCLRFDASSIPKYDRKVIGPATRATSRAAAAPVGQVMRVDSTTCSQARPLQEAGFLDFQEVWIGGNHGKT